MKLPIQSMSCTNDVLLLQMDASGVGYGKKQTDFIRFLFPFKFVQPSTRHTNTVLCAAVLIIFRKEGHFEAMIVQMKLDPSLCSTKIKHYNGDLIPCTHGYNPELYHMASKTFMGGGFTKYCEKPSTTHMFPFEL